LGVKLRRLEVECFRGFSGRRVFDFQDGVTLIVGPVGAGKTSILSAIQFALFGADFYVGFGVSRKESLVNVGCAEASVQLSFEVTGEGVYSVRRRLSVSDGRLSESVALETPGGDVFEGASKVEGVIEEVLGLDFNEFVRSVSVSYVLVHMLAYGRPLTRSRALDILLGVNAVRRFLESIPLRTVRSSLEQAKAELSAVQAEYEEAVKGLSAFNERRARISEELRGIERQIEELSAKAESLRAEAERYESLAKELENERSYLSKLKERIKHPPSEVDLYKIIEEAENLRLMLGEVLEKLKAPQSILSMLESVAFSSEKVGEAILSLEKIVDTAWNHYDKVWEDFQESIREVQLKKAELEALEKVIVELEPSVSEYEEAEERIQELESRYGELSEIEERVKSLEQDVKEISRKIQTYRSVLQLKKSLIEDAGRKGSAQCPVCGHQVDVKGVEGIKADMEQLARSIIELEKKLSENEKRLKELREVLDDIRSLKVLLVSRELEYEKYREYVERKESLSEEIREDEVKLKEEERGYRELSAILTKIDERVRDLRRRLVELEAVAEIAKVEDRIRKLEEELARYEPKYREYLDIRDKISKMLSRKNELEAQLRALDESSIRDQVRWLQERLSGLEARVARLEALYQRLEKVKSATRGVLTALRRERIEELNRRMNAIISAVYSSDIVKSVRLEVVERGRRKGLMPTSYYELFVEVGGTKYRFNDLLSDGQKTLVVLSLLLAVYSQIRRNVDFIMLDEPLPNVDERIKVAFLKSLSKALGIDQVILTTQAEEAVKELEGVNVVKLP